MTEESILLATGQSLLGVIDDDESATEAETIPVIRRSPSRIKNPAYARISNTLEKYDAPVKYIKLFILKDA
jgi:hypothetical protein